jgi:hypothetical protein
MERFVLLYSPLWILAVGGVEFAGVLDHWGDAQHLAFGVALALPIFLAPLLLERETPLLRRYALRFSALVTLFTGLQCYFGSWLFFSAFGMQYHFHVTWIWNGTPLFLYFMTVAYFSTYFVALQIAWRAFGARASSRPVRWAIRALLCYAVAFAETATMATPRMAAFFSYHDPRFVMLYGSICYGTVFFVALPLFTQLDEEGPSAPPLSRLAWDLCAINMILLVCYEFYGWVLGRLSA